jgi:hypothetical protein
MPTTPAELGIEFVMSEYEQMSVPGQLKIIGQGRTQRTISFQRRGS